MYRRIHHPKKPTDRWVRQAFAPLSDYLEREYPEEAAKILTVMEFLTNEEERFYYRNTITKGQIVFAQSGELISCDEDAFRHAFAERILDKPEQVEETPIHPVVARWVTDHLTNRQGMKYGQDVSRFLQACWGPIVNFDFGDMRIGCPIGSTNPRYCLYLYPAEFYKRILIQFVGDEIVERSCSYPHIYAFEKRQRQLIFEGWQVITVVREFFHQEPKMVRQYLSNVIHMAEPRGFVQF